MKTLYRSSLFALVLTAWLSYPLAARTAIIIRDTEAAQHVGQNVTVEATVVTVFTSKNGNLFGLRARKAATISGKAEVIPILAIDARLCPFHPRADEASGNGKAHTPRCLWHPERAGEGCARRVEPRLHGAFRGL